MLGDCVTARHLKEPSLTSQSYGTWKGVPCFYTQDLGYLSSDGNLFILGRMGSMVKVSGYRVDLGDIETVAGLCQNIYLSSCFIKKLSEELEELWMVIELKVKESKFDVFSLKTFFRASLPHYVVPKRIFIVATLPKNQNGKIDRNLVKSGCYE